MTCQEFLSRHSEMLDGRLCPGDEAGCRAHMEVCPACARYDRIVARSMTLVTEIPGVQPSTDFQERLQHRILHLQDEMARHDRFAGTGTLASLAIAAAIALVAWGPLLMPGEAGMASGLTAEAAAEERGGSGWNDPGFTPVDFYGNVAGRPALDGAPSLSAAFPGPYSPLIVEAPVTRASGRAARAVFAAYYPALE